MPPYLLSTVGARAGLSVVSDIHVDGPSATPKSPMSVLTGIQANPNFNPNFNPKFP